MKKIILIITFIYFALFKAYSQNIDDKNYYIYNLIKYSYFEKQQSEYIMFIYDDEEFTKSLNIYFKDKKMNNKTITISNITNLDNNIKCNILFISDKKSEDLFLFKNTNDMLIITNHKNMLKYGSCINLYYKDNKLQFSISVDNLHKNNIRIDKLLINLSKRE